MQPHWKSILTGGVGILALGTAALAQTPPQPPGNPLPPAAQNTPLYDPQQLPVQRGKVRQFTLTPRGDIDGLILTDGTEVKTPPRLSTQIAYAIKPGDAVTIHGLHAAALPMMQAVSITNDATGYTVVDNGPQAPGRVPPPANLSASAGGPLPGLTEVTGRIKMALHGPRGDVNGALLDDGTILRLPPPEAYRLTGLLQPGQTIVAEGIETATALGKVLQVRQLGASREQLSVVAAPPDKGKKDKKGKKGNRPPPPPPGFGPPDAPRP